MLNETERSKALANYDEGFASYDELDSLGDALLNAFSWNRSPEGTKYWEKLYSQVKNGDYTFDSEVSATDEMTTLEDRLEAIEAKLEEQMNRMQEAITEITLRGLWKESKTVINPVGAIWKDILFNFEWEEVHKCMVLLEWKWASVGGVPTVVEIRAHAKRLVEEAYRDKTTVGSGGFEAEYVEETGGVNLSFVLAFWEGEDINE